MFSTEGIAIGLWALGFGLWALGFGLWALGFGLWALGLNVELNFKLGIGLWLMLISHAFQNARKA